MSQDYDRFRIWYVEPLRALEQLPDGQGGFVALATSCFLYERYRSAVLSAQGKKANISAMINQLSRDFNVDYSVAEAFWDLIRNGLLHEGMPLQRTHGVPLPRWAFHHLYPVIALEKCNGENWLKVQPWKFMNRVIELWDTNFVLLSQSNSFPWANIGPVPA